MGTKFIPSGFIGIWTEKYVHELVEKHLSDNWTEDDIPKKSEIKFGYLLEQNVGTRVSLSLKCVDGGQEIFDKGTNFASCLYLSKVIVHLEGRLIMQNFSKDYPIGLEQMKLKVLNVINSDPTALKDTEGIHKMSAETSDPIYDIKDKQNWFALDVNITATRFMSRVTT